MSHFLRTGFSMSPSLGFALVHNFCFSVSMPDSIFGKLLLATGMLGSVFDVVVPALPTDFPW